MDITRTTAVGAVAAMALSGAVLSGSTGAQASSGRQLPGTWAVHVDPDGPMPSFTSTIVYTSTGSVVETTMNRPPSTISTGLGTWERLGDGRFALTHSKYRWEDGRFAGTVRIEETGELSPDGDRYVSRATTTILSPTQVPLATFTSTVTAERL